MNLLINADARQIPLADGSVNCIVTSPPYYGLRDYGTAKWEGGDPNCDHINPKKPSSTYKVVDEKRDEYAEKLLGVQFRDVCGKCGAVRIDQQIGLEQTPAEYVNDIVQVFREVWRILRDDGTVWLNLGDSYNGSGGAGGDYIEGGLKEGQPKYPGRHINNLKLKDLIGIPWMVAFALRDDGWYLRQDIIWHKPNPMPESVKDRCTKSHEYIFLLSKSARYYYDNEAIMEVATGFDGRKDTKYKGGPKDMAGGAHERWQYKSLETGRTGEVHSGYENPDGSLRVSFDDKGVPVRNKRDVWTVTTKPFKGAHYATFPPELVRLPILAGTSEKGHCPKCGARWERVITKGGKRITEAMINAGCDKDGNYDGTSQKDYANNKAQDASETKKRILKSMSAVYNYQWQPTCNCGLKPVPDIVLDPFCGSGTTLMVAKEMGRQAIGLDLSFQYLDTIAKPRLGILLGG